MSPAGWRVRTVATLAGAASLVALRAGALPEAALRPLQVSRVSGEPALSDSWVQSVLKDRRGFLWVGTQNGLNRFDGAGFRVYRHLSEDPRSLPASAVRVVYEDSRGRLWVASGRHNVGLALYDPVQDDFLRLSVAQYPCLADVSVTGLLEATGGRLWVGTTRGLCWLDPDRGDSRAFPFEERHPFIRALAQAADGRLWLGTNQGLLHFDPGSGKYSRWIEAQAAAPPDRPLLDAVTASGLALDGQDVLWVATEGDGLYRLDLPAQRARQYLPRPGDPASLAIASLLALRLDRQQRLWIGTQNGGLEILDLASDRFTHHRHDPADQRTLASNSIHALYEDDQQVVWIGTYDGGLNYVSPYEQTFRSLQPREGGLSDPHVSSVLEDRAGNLWLGTNGAGLDRVDGHTGRFTHFRHNPSDPGTLDSDAIFALLEDPAGAIWVGGWEAGLARLDPQSGRVTRHFRHDARDPHSLCNDRVWQILQLGAGELLVATQGGACVLELASGRFRRVSVPNAAGDDYRYAAALDARGNIWVGGTPGVQYIDRATGSVKTYVHDPGQSAGLSRGWVVSIHVDSRGSVWFGTEGGLDCLVPATGQWRHFRAETAAHDTVMGILEDAAGHLWLSSVRGLAKFVDAVRLPEQPQFAEFESRDGLHNDGFARGAAHRGRSGRLYFGGAHGLTSFAPGDLRHNPTPPPVVLTEFAIGHRLMTPGVAGSPLVQAIESTRELTVSHRAQMLSFGFAALNFVLPHKNRYAYRLEGFDSDWIEVGSQRTATYTNLSPGHYTLRVKAANNDGVWNEQGSTLGLTVTPPFWQTAWFRLLALLPVAALLLAGHLVRTRSIREHARELELRVAQRTLELQHSVDEVKTVNRELEAFAYSVSHDLRAPLRAIDGFSRILASESGAQLDADGRRLLELVRHNAGQMGSLIDDLLAFSRLGRKALACGAVDMQALAQSVWDELGRTQPGLPELKLARLMPAYGDIAVLRQVFVNLLSNAVKFSRPVAQPIVEVSSQASPDGPVYSVKDNGVGFDMAYADKLFGVFQRLHSSEEFEGTGVGLAIAERIVKRHGGRIWAEAREGAGATFSFYLPSAPRGAEP